MNSHLCITCMGFNPRVWVTPNGVLGTYRHASGLLRRWATNQDRVQLTKCLPLCCCCCCFGSAEFKQWREVHRHFSGPGTDETVLSVLYAGARAITTKVFHCMFYARRRGFNCTVIATSHVSYIIVHKLSMLKTKAFTKNFHWRIPLKRSTRAVNSEGRLTILWLCWHFFLQKHRSYQCRGITYQCSFFFYGLNIFYILVNKDQICLWNR